MEEQKPSMDKAKPLDMSRYDFSTREGRALFIAEVESCLYNGTNVDGEAVFVFQQQNVGMETWTIHKKKPNWFEVIHYDSFGDQEGITYKPA